MIAEYQFMKSLGGTRFARVTVESAPADSWTVIWDDSADPMWRRLFGAAIESGVNQAIAEARGCGCGPFAVRIVQVVSVAVDATEDAMTCAAAMAAWKSWGGNEAAVQFFHDGNWTVKFTPV